jgi:hypothetical protein
MRRGVQCIVIVYYFHYYGASAGGLAPLLNVLPIFITAGSSLWRCSSLLLVLGASISQILQPIFVALLSFRVVGSYIFILGVRASATVYHVQRQRSSVCRNKVLSHHVFFSLLNETIWSALNLLLKMEVVGLHAVDKY